MPSSNKEAASKAKPKASPSIVNGKVPPLRAKNSALRSREYLTKKEVERLMKAAKSCGRHGLRDQSMILIAFRHALRVSELVDLQWDAMDLAHGTVHINRLKNGVSGTHPLEGDEIRALRRLKREYDNPRFVFTTERGGPLTTSTVRKLLARAGDKIKQHSFCNFAYPSIAVSKTT